MIVNAELTEARDWPAIAFRELPIVSFVEPFVFSLLSPGADPKTNQNPKSPYSSKLLVYKSILRLVHYTSLAFLVSITLKFLETFQNNMIARRLIVKTS